jgi:thioredoxin-dependent peroxiredoxin
MSALSKYKVQFFGASVDPVDLNKKFSEQNKYNFPLLSDPEKSYAKALGVLSPNGAFAQRWTYVIDDQGVIRSIDKMVKPANHGKDLAAKLEELGIPKK